MINEVQIQRELYQDSEALVPVVKDITVFLRDYLPARPLIRDEFNDLYLKIKDFSKRGGVSIYSVIGHRGSGKTLFSKYLILQLNRDGIPAYYIDCQKYDTTGKILRHVFFLNDFSMFVGAVIESNKQGKSPVLFFDDAQFLNDYEILNYFLKHSNYSIQFVFLSIRDSLLYFFKKKTISLDRIRMKNYSKDELFEILNSRAELGLKKVVKASIEVLSEYLVERYSGDASLGVRILPTLALRDWPIKKEEIEHVVRWFVNMEISGILSELYERDLAVLFSAIFESDLNTFKVKVSRISREILGYGLSWERVQDALNNLINMGLLIIVTERDEQELPVSKHLKLLCDRKLVMEEMVKRHRKELAEVLGAPSNPVAQIIRTHSSFPLLEQLLKQ